MVLIADYHLGNKRALSVKGMRLLVEIIQKKEWSEKDFQQRMDFERRLVLKELISKDLVFVNEDCINPNSDEISKLYPYLKFQQIQDMILSSEFKLSSPKNSEIIQRTLYIFCKCEGDREREDTRIKGILQREIVKSMHIHDSSFNNPKSILEKFGIIKTYKPRGLIIVIPTFLPKEHFKNKEPARAKKAKKYPKYSKKTISSNEEMSDDEKKAKIVNAKRRMKELGMTIAYESSKSTLTKTPYESIMLALFGASNLRMSRDYLFKKSGLENEFENYLNTLIENRLIGSNKRSKKHFLVVL